MSSEARLRAFSVAASVLLHAAVLALGPGLREQPVEPRRVVSLVLLESSAPAPIATLPPAPPPRPAEARRATPAQRALTPPVREAPEPPLRSAAVPQSETSAPAPSATETEVVSAVPASGARPAAALPQGEAPAPAPIAPPEYAAAYLNNPAPAYPRNARRAGEQGTVVLRVLVATDGSPARVEVERSSGSASLDSAALDAVQRWRFVPARRGSTPVEAWVKVPVVFRLAPDA